MAGWSRVDRCMFATQISTASSVSGPSRSITAQESLAVSQPLTIGMIGYGFMGRAHTNAYKRVSDFFPELAYHPVLQSACGRDEAKVQAFARQWGYASHETDWQHLVNRDDIDAVDICVPNNLHKEIALAAAAAGKMILCEKPLAINVAEGEAMCQAVEAAGVANMVWYNYRRIPAVSLAKTTDRGRSTRPDLSLSLEFSARLDHLKRGSPRRSRDVEIGFGRSRFGGDRRLARPLYRYGAVAQWPDQRCQCDDRNICHRANACRDAASPSSRRSTTLAPSCVTSRTVRWACSSRRVTRVVTKPSIPSKSTEHWARFAGTCMT